MEKVNESQHRQSTNNSRQPRQPTTRSQLQPTNSDSQKSTFRDGIFKLLRSPGIDSKESIPPAVVACRAGTKTCRFLDPIDCSKIPAQHSTTETLQQTINNYHRKAHLTYNSPQLTDKNTTRQGWSNRIYCTLKEINL